MTAHNARRVVPLESRFSRFVVALLGLVGLVLAASGIGALTARSTLAAGGVVFAVALFLVVLIWPEMGAYVFLFATPLIVGINRDALLPVLRPNEALLLVIASAVVLRRVTLWWRGEGLILRVSQFDVALFVVVVLGSVFSLGWMAARALTPGSDDILHALVFWKYFALYYVISASITTRDQVRRCLWLILSANAVVAAIGILQAVGLLGFDRLVNAVYPAIDGGPTAIARGTSTLAQSIAMGDVMAISLAVTLGLIVNRQATGWIAWLLAALFALGGVGSGQFSGLIALIVAAAAVGVVAGRLRQIATVAVPGLIAASLVLSPVVGRRLEGFGTGDSALPISWATRWDNLTEIVWPRLFGDVSWVLGRRTSPRIPAWETWREWVFIESGHTWMLWVGGIPLLLAFLWFMYVTLRATARVAAGRTDIIGTAAIGAFAGASIVLVLSLTDAHLTLRGTADLFFPLLALAFLGLPGKRQGCATRLLMSPESTIHSVERERERNRE